MEFPLGVQWKSKNIFENKMVELTTEWNSVDLNMQQLSRNMIQFLKKKNKKREYNYVLFRGAIATAQATGWVCEYMSCKTKS